MAINYNAGTNTITVTGGTSGAPNTLQDIYDADVAGGWGVVTKQGDWQYKCDALLYIGDGSTSTYFASEKECLEQNEEFKVLANAEARFGVWSDGHSIDGSMLIFNKDISTYVLYYIYGTLKFYGSIATGRLHNNIEMFWFRFMAGSSCDLRESEFNHFMGMRWFDSDAYMENCLIRDSSWGFYISTNLDYTWTGVKADYMIQISSSTDITFWNPDSPNLAIISPAGWHNIHTFVNSVQDPDVTISAAAEDDVSMHLDNTFDLLVVDDNGDAVEDVTVLIKDVDGTTVVNTTTAADGTITQQLITRKSFTGSTSTEKLHTPHTIKVSKSGYETYYTSFTLAAATDWVLCLKRSIHVNLLEDDPIIKLDPESYEDKKRRKFIRV